jgi:hypothetical protein
VESVPSPDGRERRWRARVASIDWDAGAEADEELQAAAAVARAALLEVSDDNVRSYLMHERALSPAWREAATFLQTAIVATPPELAELGEQISALLRPFMVSERERTPRGSRVVHVSVRAVPKP